MYGFSITKGITPLSSAKEKIIYKDYACANNMISKFENDKLFVETTDFIVIVDGVVTNKKALLTNKEWVETVVELYENVGESFFSCFRGNFSGALYDKKADKLIIYSDQLGQKFIYYTPDINKFACSSIITNIYDIFNQNHISYNLDDIAAYQLLTFGYMLENYTLCNEIKKIRPGHYIVLSEGKIEEKSYYTLDNTPNFNRPEKGTLEQLDYLFRQAVDRQYKKDLEYGYKHVCALSGGLDCRMTTFVANELGYKNQLNITFSESNYWDETTPKQMAKYLKHGWLFKALDNGLWLYDVDDITKNTGGNVLYYGLAHGNSLFRLMNFYELGMIHSGQMGDVVISCNEEKSGGSYKFGDGAYSSKFICEINDMSNMNYCNHEIAMWYTRYLNGANNGQQNEYNYTETFSPFLDLDLLEFCLTIPAELRHNHNLYKKWILLKYPAAANYVWESIGAKLTNKSITIKGSTYPLINFPRKVMRKALIKLGIGSLIKEQSMNPLNLYLCSNDELNKYLDRYFDYIYSIKNIKLQNILLSFKHSGNAVEKIQAVSLLSAVKLYFTEN